MRALKIEREKYEARDQDTLMVPKAAARRQLQIVAPLKFSICNFQFAIFNVFFLRPFAAFHFTPS